MTPSLASPSTRPSLRQAQRFSLTTSMRQSLRIMTLRNHAICRFMREIAAENPLLDITYPSASPRVEIAANPFPLEQVASSAVRPVTLTEHLFREISLALPPGKERSAALALVAYLTPAGWLENEGENAAAKMGIEGEAYEALLARLHLLEPVGVFARNLTECLRVQLADRGEYDRVSSLLLEHLPALLEGGIDKLARDSGLSRDEALAGLARIKRLNPKPGAGFLHDNEEIFRPDLIVTKTEGGGYDVSVNSQTLPVISVSSDEISEHSEAKDLLKKARSQASMFNAIVNKRNQMLLAAAQYVVVHQLRFIEEDNTALLPLTMTELAERLDCHPTTVSRLVADKLVFLPRGMVALADFFSSSLTMDGGGVIAIKAASAMVAAMISGEDRQAPLTDQAIAEVLGGRGIHLSRRTIAKYRASHHIGVARQRRGFYQATAHNAVGAGDM